MNVTAYQIAERFIGMKEVDGKVANPAILAMLQLDADWPNDDSTPWCSSFINYISWLLRLPRSKSLLARSWLNVGTVIDINDLKVGPDIVILKRGAGEQPGPENTTASGHVGFFSGKIHNKIHLLGGNQGNMVSVAPFDISRFLGARRLYNEIS